MDTMNNEVLMAESMRREGGERGIHQISKVMVESFLL
jgi:hypothetical protein